MQFVKFGWFNSTFTYTYKLLVYCNISIFWYFIHIFHHIIVLFYSYISTLQLELLCRLRLKVTTWWAFKTMHLIKIIQQYIQLKLSFFGQLSLMSRLSNNNWTVLISDKSPLTFHGFRGFFMWLFDGFLVLNKTKLSNFEVWTMCFWKTTRNLKASLWGLSDCESILFSHILQTEQLLYWSGKLSADQFIMKITTSCSIKTI